MLCDYLCLTIFEYVPNKIKMNEKCEPNRKDAIAMITNIHFANIDFHMQISKCTIFLGGTCFYIQKKNRFPITELQFFSLHYLIVFCLSLSHFLRFRLIKCIVMCRPVSDTFLSCCIYFKINRNYTHERLNIPAKVTQ